MHFNRTVVSLTLCLLSVGGCDRSADAQKTAGHDSSPTSTKADAVGPVKPQPLEPTFLTRALTALEPHLSDDARLLELRASATVVELQLVIDQSVSTVRYREAVGAGDQQLAPAGGVVDEPAQVPVYGSGSLDDNAFSPKDVKLQRITQAFPIAVKSVDPLDGWVQQLVIRRYLPFGRAVRARIYVGSPRMPGSIDTNGNGVPLKR